MPPASILDFAASALERVRLVMMTWKESEALASTFVVAKPTPELAPVKFVST